MRGAQIIHRDLPIAEAAHALFSRLFRLSDKERDPDFRHWDLRLRKRWVVLLHCGELAAGLFSCSNAPHETGFSAKIIAPKLVARGEVDYAKLIDAAWRLVAKHHETILAIALALARVKNPDNCHIQ